MVSIAQLDQGRVLLVEENFDAVHIGIQAHQGEQHVARELVVDRQVVEQQHRRPVGHTHAHGWAPHANTNLAVGGVHMLRHAHAHATSTGSTVTSRQVGVCEVPALLVVVLDGQGGEFGRLDLQRAAPRIQVLPVKHRACLLCGACISKLHKTLEHTVTLCEGDHLKNRAELGKDLAENIEGDGVELVVDLDQQDGAGRVALQAQAGVGQVLVLRVAEVDGPLSNHWRCGGINIEHVCGCLSRLKLNERLSLALEHEHIHDPTKRLAQLQQLHLSAVRRNIAAVQYSRGSLNTRPLGTLAILCLIVAPLLTSSVSHFCFWSSENRRSGRCRRRKRGKGEEGQAREKKP
eukprot:comp23744_c1_seq2/m.40992 comp23744_c1_seq2/g.40992  ORF comp23744_c1_seq2/g.40992 comp23744_c1_seq2/m.40992 type:complete len:348 (+) comp23744_c1_seq2:972-2015(+)